MDLRNAHELRLRDDLSISSSSGETSSSDASSSTQSSSNDHRSSSVSAGSVSGDPLRSSPERARDANEVAPNVVEQSGSQPAKRKKKKKKSPEQLVEGVCWLSARELDDFRRDHSVPYDVKFRLPSSNERADDPPRGYFTCVLGHFNLAYLWFPIPEVVMQFLACYKLCLAQITPHSMRNIVGLLTRGYEEGEDISLTDMMCMLNAVKGRRALYHQVVPRPGFKLIGEAPRKDHDWERYFFFVRLDSCAVEGDLSLVRREFRIRGRAHSFSLVLRVVVHVLTLGLFSFAQLVRRRFRRLLTTKVSSSASEVATALGDHSPSRECLKRASRL